MAHGHCQCRTDHRSLTITSHTSIGHHTLRRHTHACCLFGRCCPFRPVTRATCSRFAGAWPARRGVDLGGGVGDWAGRSTERRGGVAASATHEFPQDFLRNYFVMDSSPIPRMLNRKKCARTGCLVQPSSNYPGECGGMCVPVRFVHRHFVTLRACTAASINLQAW